MAPVDLIRAARAAGLALRTDGVGLGISGPKPVIAAFIDRFREHKAAVVEAIKAERSATYSPNAPPASTPQDAANAVPHRPTFPVIGDGERELSPAEIIAVGAIMKGWSPRGWAERLRYLAQRCKELRPDLADYYSAWAAGIDGKLRAGPAGRQSAD